MLALGQADDVQYTARSLEPAYVLEFALYRKSQPAQLEIRRFTTSLSEGRM